MSDDEQPLDSEIDVHEDDHTQAAQNPVEYVEDSCERNQNSWLKFPPEFIRPAKMCSINKYVQCVEQGFLQHSMHHIPTGPEYVLVGHDSPSLPAHMFQWIWAMTQINQMKQYQNCVVPVVGLTDVSYSRKGKQLMATNIKRRLVISQAWQMDEQLRYEPWFQDMDGRQETVMMESIQELRQGNNYYADVNPIQMMWGIVPVEYTHHGAKVRRIFHVLKTIPAPGFDLMRCLVDISRKGDQKMPSGVTYARVMQVVQDVINYECNRNLHIVGFFGRSHPLPHPIQVMDDPSSPMNPQAILSPFFVMRKILLQLPVSELSGLVIDGFPKTVASEERARCFQFFSNMQAAYRRRLGYYHRVFARALQGSAGSKVAAIAPVALPLVLASPECENLDNVFCYMNMTFNLGKWLEGLTASLEKAELLRMPQLSIATLTPFQYVTACDVSAIDFIRAHIGDPGEDLDETKLSHKYSMDNGSWGDMPHAGMFKNARESIRTSLRTMAETEGTLERLIATYQNYMRAQSTIHTQAVLVDLMMSDRVLHCAQCLDRLSGRINAGVRRALSKQVPGEIAKTQRELLAGYPDAAYHLRLMHTLSLHNKTIRANAVNLSTLLAILISDTLTHLGAHHETWNWMMYTVQVMGGAGHLRAVTDDHGSRTQVTFTSKPNSVGFNAVITKTYKAFSTLVTELLPDLSSDFLEMLRFMKLDRTTRAGVESVSAVMFVNGVRELAPDRKTFMRPIIMDEGYRSMDAAALNGMVCSIPRDSDGGSGNILKAVDPGKGGGAHLQGHQRQIPGLSPFLLAMTSNSNPHTAVIGECIKTFSVVTAMFPAGAQPGGCLAQALSGQKRGISDYQSSNTNAASTMPSEKEEREDLAWVMCVLLMASRQLALVNKTGQVNLEINLVGRLFVEWIRNIIHQHFMSFFSSMLLLSYDRVIAGYMTRQVASTFMATCARHYAESESVTEANTRILLDSECAPVTPQTCSLAVCNAISHLVDANLILVNQLIRDKLHTPVVPVEFVVRIFSDEPLDMTCTFYEQIFSWASTIVQNRNTEIECIMGYASINKLGSMDDYNAKEAYLESYFGIAKNNFYTYLSAVKECCSKVFDLTNFLSLSNSMLDFTRLLSRMGVGGDGMLQGGQNGPMADCNRSTFLFSQNAQPSAENAQQRGGIVKCWVNVAQHLLITALQGSGELHADNIFNFGANLTELILSRCAPLQCTPAGVIVHETFHHVYEEVLPFHTMVGSRPEYFVRTINDYSAFDTGRTSELPAVLGPHPPEDVMHLGAWIQLYSILYNGAKPMDFQTFPLYNGRPPELVRGRKYPLLSLDQDPAGTITLQHQSATVTLPEDGWRPRAPVPIEKWWTFLCDRKLMVAPLVFRHYAAFRLLDGGICVAVQRNGQFIDDQGKYHLGQSQDTLVATPFPEAHGRLLPLGTHILVRADALVPHGLTSATEWARGCLRYPQLAGEEDPYRLYITMPVRENPSQGIKARVISVAVQDCLIFRDGIAGVSTFVTIRGR